MPKIQVYNPKDMKEFLASYNPDSSPDSNQVLLAQNCKSGGEEYTLNKLKERGDLGEYMGIIDLDCSDMEGKSLKGLELMTFGQTLGGIINLSEFGNVYIDNSYSSGDLTVIQSKGFGDNEVDNQNTKGNNKLIVIFGKGNFTQYNQFSKGKNKFRIESSGGDFSQYNDCSNGNNLFKSKHLFRKYLAI